jgi:hypothetical protein
MSLEATGLASPSVSFMSRMAPSITSCSISCSAPFTDAAGPTGLPDAATGLTAQAHERSEEFAVIESDLQALKAQLAELGQQAQQIKTGLKNVRNEVGELRTEMRAAVDAFRSASQRVPEPPLDVDITGSITPGEQKEIARARVLVKIGDIAGARLLLEHALQRGNPFVAYRLAETYDPDRLAEWGVVGVRPDAKKARELYRQATTERP